jgi:hypothetical protein
MHQKQPPAKIAVFVSPKALRAKLQKARRRNIFRMISDEKPPEEKLFQELSSIESTPDATRDPEIEFTPANYFAPLDLALVFGRVAPLEIDLGCGDGAFIAQLAAIFRSEISSASKSSAAASDEPAKRRRGSKFGTCASCELKVVMPFSISSRPVPPMSFICFFPIPG